MTNVKKAKSYGIAWANQMFKDFSNPKWQGENFTWEKFPDMAAALASASVFMSFSHKVKNIHILKEVVKQSCKKRCEVLVKQMKNKVN